MEFEMGATAKPDRLPIIQYWHSPRVPAEIEVLTATFGEQNPDRRHLLFDEGGAEEFIGTHLGDREVTAFRACAVPAMQADYFRYCAVLVLGGIYVDADFRCLRPLRELIDTTTGGLLFRREPRGNLINGFFVFDAAGHPLLRLALDIATMNIERQAATKVHMVTGPWIFSALAAARGGELLDDPRLDSAGPEVKRLRDSFADAVVSRARVLEAFEDVRIDSLDHALKWISHPFTPPDYKSGRNHWVNWHRGGRAIFR